MVNEWSFYWLVSQEYRGYPCCWEDGRYFVLHGSLGDTDAADDVSMNHTFVDGHGEFQRLHHKETPADEHYYNEDYVYAQAPN